MFTNISLSIIALLFVGVVGVSASEDTYHLYNSRGGPPVGGRSTPSVIYVSRDGGDSSNTTQSGY